MHFPMGLHVCLTQDLEKLEEGSQWQLEQPQAQLLSFAKMKQQISDTMHELQGSPALYIVLQRTVLLPPFYLPNLEQITRGQS